MKNQLKFITIGLILVLLSCKSDPNKQIDEGTVHGDMYSSDEIGWTIKIPEGWKVTSRDELQEHDENGLKAMQEVQGEIDVTGLKHLVSFQKDQFNNFSSTSEPFNAGYEGKWEDNNRALQELLYETYRQQGIEVDTSSSKALVDALEFEVFYIAIHGPDGQIILNQELYSRYINGFDFGVNINYNNSKDKDEMTVVWKDSKFIKSH